MRISLQDLQAVCYEDKAMSLEKIVAQLVQKVERRFYGKYRGFVVDNADPETLGRLKVKVPSVLGNNIVTGWALPCTPYGGDMNQGFLFIPEVGAGVWVEFEEGDLEFPIWVGTFWSKPGGDSELPKSNDDASDGAKEGTVQDPPTRKIIKTKAGHTIQFEDASGNEMIRIVEAINKHVITMDKNGIIIKDGTNSHVITMDKDGINIEEGAKEIMITDKSGNTINTKSDGIIVEDKSGNKIKMDAAGLALLTNDSANWCPNSIKACLFTGAPHGGPSGAPPVTTLKGS
jgi:uncharacterized protein involved in type VI secretion and phage assembly